MQLGFAQKTTLDLSLVYRVIRKYSPCGTQSISPGDLRPETMTFTADPRSVAEPQTGNFHWVIIGAARLLKRVGLISWWSKIRDGSWLWNVSYISIVLWVETSRIPRLGRRAELMYAYVTTGIALIKLRQWTWKLDSNEVAHKSRFEVIQWFDTRNRRFC